MASVTNIDTFHYGEYIEIVLAAKNRDGTVIASPAAQVVSLTISDTEGGPPILEWNTTADPTKISLTDAVLGEYTATLLPADTETLNEGQRYFYNLWSDLGGLPVLQAKGVFRLLPASEPS